MPKNFSLESSPEGGSVFAPPYKTFTFPTNTDILLRDTSYNSTCTTDTEFSDFSSTDDDFETDADDEELSSFDAIFSGDDVNSPEACEHFTRNCISGVEVCSNCGEELHKDLSLEPEWRYYKDQDSKSSSDPSRCRARNLEERTIYNDIAKFDIPLIIREDANKLYAYITNGNIKRGNFRKSLIFACVFNAYKYNNIPRLTNDLAIKFNLDRKKISKGLNEFNLAMKKEKKPVYLEKTVFIEHILAKFFGPDRVDNEWVDKSAKVCNVKLPEGKNPSDSGKAMSSLSEKFNQDILKTHTENVRALYTRIHNRSSDLNRSNPYSVISSLIYYYFCKSNIETSYSKFSKVVTLSSIIIEKNSKIIDKILSA